MELKRLIQGPSKRIGVARARTARNEASEKPKVQN